MKLDREDNPIAGIQRFLSEALKERLPIEEEAEVGVIVTDVMHRLCDEYGGACIYLHKNHEGRLSGFYQAVAAEFNGMNIPELARKYDRSEMRIRQILRAEQKKVRTVKK